MDWSDLPYFLAVARAGQVARAGAALGTDATTVARRVRRLERALGERLFEQTARGQALTPAGARLIAQAEGMERIAHDIGREGSSEQPVQANVRVSVSEGFGTWFISRHLGEFAAAHPHITVDLVATSGFLNPTRRETDIAVLLARPRRGPLITSRLSDYAMQLYGATDYLAAHPPVRGAGDLRRHRLIGYIPDIIYAPELRYLEELPIATEPQLRSSSINAQHRMIAAGAGIGVLPHFVGSLDPTLSVVLPEVRIMRSFWKVMHRETHRFAHLAAFGDWLTALASRHRAVLTGT